MEIFVISPKGHHQKQRTICILKYDMHHYGFVDSIGGQRAGRNWSVKLHSQCPKGPLAEHTTHSNGSRRYL